MSNFDLSKSYAGLKSKFRVFIYHFGVYDFIQCFSGFYHFAGMFMPGLHFTCFILSRLETFPYEGESLYWVTLFD